MSENNMGDLMAAVFGKVKPLAADERAKLEADDRRRAIQAKRADLEQAGVPARMLDAMSDGEPTKRTTALDAVTEWLASEERDLLVLSGGVGCGKTFAAAYACTQARWPVFCDPMTLGTLKRFDAQAVEPFVACSLLVIDDLGQEFADDKGNAIQFIEALLARRQARKLRTLITTNLLPGQFKARYDERIADRIRESGKFVSCGESSMRPRQPVKAVP